MSKLSLFLLIFGIGCSGILSAQKKDFASGNNEIKLNIPMVIAGLPEIDYERIVDENVGVGIAASFAVEQPTEIAYRNLIMPYGRLYFGKKRAYGFFIEANMAFSKQRRVDDYIDYRYIDSTMQYEEVAVHIDESSFNFGFGSAVGVKLMTKNGYVGEIFAGGGRFFGTSVKNGYFRMGLTIGKRF